jgi:hypothetical protein
MDLTQLSPTIKLLIAVTILAIIAIICFVVIFDKSAKATAKTVAKTVAAPAKTIATAVAKVVAPPTASPTKSLAAAVTKPTAAVISSAPATTPVNSVIVNRPAAAVKSVAAHVAVPVAAHVAVPVAAHVAAHVAVPVAAPVAVPVAAPVAKLAAKLPAAPVVTKAELLNKLSKMMASASDLTNLAVYINFITTLNPEKQELAGTDPHLFTYAIYTGSSDPNIHLFARLGQYLSETMKNSCTTAAAITGVINSAGNAPIAVTPAEIKKCVGFRTSAGVTYSQVVQLHTEAGNFAQNVMDVSLVAGSGSSTFNNATPTKYTIKPCSAVVPSCGLLANLNYITGSLVSSVISKSDIWTIINESKAVIAGHKSLLVALINLVTGINWMTHEKYTPPWYSGFYELIGAYITRLNKTIKDIKSTTHELSVMTNYYKDV